MAPTPTVDAPEQAPPRVGVVCAALMLALMLAALDQAIVGTALPTIVGDLGGLGQYTWVVTAYLLASTVSTPLHGKLGDLYGRERLFQLAIAVAVDVLVTERRELARYAAADEVSPPTVERAHRDLRAEAAALAG